MHTHFRWILPAIALLALTASFGVAQASAATPCWPRLIADWADNGTVDGSFSPRCYRAAMAHAPTDLRIYSTIEDDLRFALQTRMLRRVSAETARKPAAHVATSTVRAGTSSTSPMVAALGAGLGIIGLAISAALVIGRRRRRRA